jgi:hypothetical protein
LRLRRPEGPLVKRGNDSSHGVASRLRGHEEMNPRLIYS